MINQQVLEGRWNEIRGDLKRRWGELTDDELQSAHGNVTQLVGLIQRKTGESREAVEHFLDEIVTHSGSTMQRATESARAMGQQAAERARQYRQEAGQQLRERMSQAETLVQERPAESLAVAFGAGIIAGVVVGLLLRSGD